jgi:hypothetical protein
MVVVVVVAAAVPTVVAVNSSEPLESIFVKMGSQPWSQFHTPVNVTTFNVSLNSPIWEHFNGSIISQGLQMWVYGICNVRRNYSSWSQRLEVILWCFQNCMICHKIVCSYLGKTTFIHFISDTLKNNNLQATKYTTALRSYTINTWLQEHSTIMLSIKTNNQTDISTAIIPQFSNTLCKKSVVHVGGKIFFSINLFANTISY